MKHVYVVTGEMTGERTVTLDETLPLPSMRVRLTVEPETAAPQSYAATIAAIRARQKARRHQPRTRVEVDAALQNERENWGD